MAALVAGGELPAGFDPGRLAATRRALLRKRAGEVGAAWPLLAASLGDDFVPRFSEWAAGRPPGGSAADGLAFARTLRDLKALPAPAVEELAAREPRSRFRRAFHR